MAQSSSPLSKQTSPQAPIYSEEKEIQWQVNTGGNTIHAKRLPGRFRRFKWLTAAGWLIFFIAPYLRWDGQQAILFDIPGRQFHLFALTVHPQDVWTLSFGLLFLAMLLMLTTVIAGRAFCGYACFQTVWTDVFTWIEDRLEGPPRKRYQLDAAPWGLRKLRIKLGKHLVWLSIAALTGLSFAAWFTDAYQLWHDFFTLQAHKAAWTTLALITLGTYVFAGFMREQLCLWLCPYSRIQGVMYDPNTLLPTYDEPRGEPRAKLGKHQANTSGGCVDCDQCLAVCPTGVDIREGQQVGCITCGLCIDACDSVMDKLQRPRGLIRYASQNQLAGTGRRSFMRRPQVLLSALLLLTSASAIAYGLGSISQVEFSLVAQRQPLYVLLSDGSIQNRYQLRIFNKSSRTQHYQLRIEGDSGVQLVQNDRRWSVDSGKLLATDIAVHLPRDAHERHSRRLSFALYNLDQPDHAIERVQTLFSTPAH